MKREPFPSKFFAVVLGILFGLIPLGIYGVTLGSVPSLHPQEAIAWLEDKAVMAVLIDVRQGHDFKDHHVPGAVTLPWEQILEMESSSDLQIEFQSKILLVVCDVGLRSAQVVRHLKGLGLTAYNIRGGIQDWGRAWGRYPDSSYTHFETADGILVEPFHQMTRGEQAAAAVAMLWFKPTYMLLSAGISLVLLRVKSLDLRLLGWGLLIFLVGEIACAINYAFLKDNSYLAEYIHSYSMILAFSLAGYALAVGLDDRLVHYSQAEPRCALLSVCGPCTKYKPVPCTIRRLAQLVGVMMIVIGFIPLLAPYCLQSYNTQIGPVIHYYVRPFVHQWVEIRYSPTLGIVLVTLGLVIMAFTPEQAIHPRARLLLCGGVGFLGFGFFRVVLGLIYAERLVWATFWEEATELLFVVALIYILWYFFRRTDRRSATDALLGLLLSKGDE